MILPFLLLSGVGYALYKASKKKLPEYDPEDIPPQDFQEDTGGGSSYYIPSYSDINRASSFNELEAFYEYINVLYLSQIIDYSTYRNLYDAYASRWNQLALVK